MAAIVEVLATKEALIQRAAVLMEEKIRLAIETQGRCSVALAGGSTPKPLYANLAQASLPWEQLHCFWGDERYVPADHPDSNEGMARKAWLDQVPIPPSNIHPMPTLSGDPALDAATYNDHLDRFFAVTGADFPVFDIILLGLGDDGHTASLFPHTPALEVCDRFITVGNKDGQPRLTFTIPLINAARSVIFLVAGENKQPALKAIFQTEGDSTLDRQYPARFIRPQGELLWLLDAAAGQY
ncbi:MAG: 6-phosphogluconolactonase [Prochlorotrichaceae cyanobacterium]|jgi:6-phosphogluconolactonase